MPFTEADLLLNSPMEEETRETPAPPSTSRRSHKRKQKRGTGSTTGPAPEKKTITLS